MRVKFYDKQEPVKIVKSDEKVFVFICLKEKQITETFFPEFSEFEPYEQDLYEYDYAEIIEAEGVLDLNDVMKNPENYIDYEPYVEEPDTLEKHRADIDYLAMEIGVDL